MRERTGWLTKAVGGIGTASFLSDLGHEVPTSLLPRLLTQTFGASAAALGIIEGLAGGLAGFFRFFGGALADDPDRRRDVAVGGYAATAVLTAGIGAATTVWQVGLLRAGGWAARGLRVPARNALLADAVPADAYGRAYGFERTMDNLGAVAGPLLALALIAVFDWRGSLKRAGWRGHGNRRWRRRDGLLGVAVTARLETRTFTLSPGTHPGHR